MDEDRKIRFLVAPIVFLASFLWGLVLDESRSLANILPVPISMPDDIPGLVAAAAAGGSIVFTLGVAIGTLTYVVLRLAFLLCRFRKGGSHEVVLNDDAFERVWKLVGAEGDPDHKLEVFAGVTLDHGVVCTRQEGVHKWLARRWSAFSISVTSCSAILLSLVAGMCCEVSMSAAWLGPSVIMTAIFATSAIFAWRDSMQMLAFQARIATRP